ncbi:MAG: hypothetical protein WCP89_02970 [archaeon]
MKKGESAQKGFSKKAVVVLVIIAVVLAGFAFAYNYFDMGKKVSTNSSDSSVVDSSGGKVGIVILPPNIEDKGVVPANGA